MCPKVFLYVTRVAPISLEMKNGPDKRLEPKPRFVATHAGHASRQNIAPLILVR